MLQAQLLTPQRDFFEQEVLELVLSFRKAGDGLLPQQQPPMVKHTADTAWAGTTPTSWAAGMLSYWVNTAKNQHLPYKAICFCIYNIEHCISNNFFI